MAAAKAFRRTASAGLPWTLIDRSRGPVNSGRVSQAQYRKPAAHGSEPNVRRKDSMYAFWTSRSSSAYSCHDQGRRLAPFWAARPISAKRTGRPWSFESAARPSFHGRQPASSAAASVPPGTG
ncbi:MAG: hypothetical protein M0D55_10275 [Elusimicrobiota bacterium]|nr:MAG: hypothetical protein M0D55_10275 [Elusimicrobiota bacterium]